MDLYQIRLWCSDDNCEEFWFDKELSDIYTNLEEAQKELAKYDGMTASQIEHACEVVSVRNNRPRIERLMTITSKQKRNIPFGRLTAIFPFDTLWANGCAEIVGYSKEKNIHIVIDDGMCVSAIGWCVHVYCPGNPEHYRNWAPNKYRECPLKCLSNEEKRIEMWVDFYDKESVDKFEKALVAIC